MSVSLHDTHLHLDLFDRPKEILDQIEKEKVYTIAVTNVPEVFHHTHALVQGSRYVRAALGFHPELVYQHRNQIVKFLDLLPQSRYIGEVGLDNYNKPSADYSVQKKIFEEIVSACDIAKNKILTVHSRRAEEDLISLIGPNFSGKIILHWYSGSIKAIDNAIYCGFYFSINYAMTQSERGRKVIKYIPPTRLLLESDSPFVKMNKVLYTPLIIKSTINEICAIRQDKNIDQIIKNNFKNLIT